MKNLQTDKILETVIQNMLFTSVGPSAVLQWRHTFNEAARDHNDLEKCIFRLVKTYHANNGKIEYQRNQFPCFKEASDETTT